MASFSLLICAYMQTFPVLNRQFPCVEKKDDFIKGWYKDGHVLSALFIATVKIHFLRGTSKT